MFWLEKKSKTFYLSLKKKKKKLAAVLTIKEIRGRGKYYTKQNWNWTIN